MLTAILGLAVTLGACSDSDPAASDSGDEAGSTGSASTAMSEDSQATAAYLLDVPTLGTTVGTDGRVYIADASGRAVQLRGFNIKTREPLTDASGQLLDDGAERGFDLLRLSIYWDQLEAEQGVYDEEYLESIETVLDRAQERGINVIVSFHQDVFGPAFGAHGIPEWATRTEGLAFTEHDNWLANYLEPAVQAAWDHLYDDQDIRDAQAATWALVADRFGEHPAVLGYDLLNEPFGRLREGENIVAAASRIQATQLTDMYQRLVTAMRAEDPDGWFFIEAPNVASIGLPVTVGAIDDDKVVFFPHMYDADIEAATYGGDEAGLDLSFFETYEAVIRTYAEEHGVPMMVGEWGLASPDEPGMDVFVDESLALMDRVGSGWTVFNWCRGTGYCPIDEDGNDRPNIGQIVRPWPRAISGAPTSSAFDADTSELTVVFEDNDATGPTDIFVAASTVYPDGWTVETSDPADAWSHEFDEATGVVSVTTPDTGGSHAICLKPEGAPAGCQVPAT